MRVLYAEDDDGIRQIFAFYMENKVDNLDLVEVADGERAIEKLQEGKEFDLVISDYNMPEKNGGQVFQFMVENNVKCPFMLFSSDRPQDHSEFENFLNHNPSNGFIQKPVPTKAFYEAISKYVEAKEKSTKNIIALSDYLKVRLVYFYRFNKTECDVFLKLSDTNYVKVLHKDTHYVKDDLQKYYRKNVRYLYIANKDQEHFTARLGQMPFLALDIEKLSGKEKEEALMSTHIVIHELIKSVGISKQVVEMTNSYVNETLNLVKKDFNLFDLIGRMKSRQDYIYDHSLMVGAFCAQMCELLKWDINMAVQKLCAAALFHDITLENPSLAKIKSITDPELAKFTKDEKLAYEKHPEEAASMVNKIHQKIYFGVDQIILQHHEAQDGSGFPKRLGFHNIAPLSCAFIVAHDLADQLYDADFDEDKAKEIFLNLKFKYKEGNFKKCVQAVAEIVQEYL